MRTLIGILAMVVTGCYTPVNLGGTASSTGEATGAGGTTGASSATTTTTTTTGGACSPVHQGCGAGGVSCCTPYTCAISTCCSENGAACETTSDCCNGDHICTNNVCVSADTSDVGTSATNGGGSTGAATGGSTTGSSSGGTINLTFTTVDIHPAAKAALIDAGAPVPILTNLSPAGGPYALDLEGVGIVGGNIAITTLFSTPITVGQTYSYNLSPSLIVAEAPLGILTFIHPSYPDGGLATSGDGGLVQLPCSLVEGDGIAGALTAGGLGDYFFPSIAQVGGSANPPTSNFVNAVAYAVPMSYASMLNCAGSAGKTTRDSDLGVALVYATNGTDPASGTPIAGASFAIKNGPAGQNEPAPVYYTGNFTGTETTSTDSTGVGTFVDVIVGSLPTQIAASDPANDQFFVAGVGISPNAFFMAYPFETEGCGATTCVAGILSSSCGSAPCPSGQMCNQTATNCVPLQMPLSCTDASQCPCNYSCTNRTCQIMETPNGCTVGSACGPACLGFQCQATEDQGDACMPLDGGCEGPGAGCTAGTCCLFNGSLLACEVQPGAQGGGCPSP